jgi:hypothetical protein
MGDELEDRTVGPERDLVDDGTVRDEETLLRRIHPNWISPRSGELLGIAFMDRHTNEVSVFREEMATMADVMRAWPWMGCATVAARVPRANEHGVTPDPLEDETLAAAAHAVIFPRRAPSQKRIRKFADRIALQAEIRRRPPPQP